MQKTNPISLKLRFRALFFHLLFSGLLLSIALVMVFGVWYPSPLDIAVGVTTIYLMLLVVDLIVGPLLTFIVYKEDKKKLRFDLTVILIVQISAYLFGLHTVAQGRPAWQVFVVDDIELVSPIDIRKTEDFVMRDAFAPNLFKKPQWVAAVYSSDPDKMQEQREDEMFDGINLSVRPETYQPMKDMSIKILDRLKPTSDLRKFNTEDEIQREIDKYNNIHGWLPVKASELDMVALFNENGDPIKIVNLRPWE